MTIVTKLNSPKLMSEKDVADFLGMSVKWVQQARHKGSGPPFLKLGSATNSPVRYLLDDLIKWCRLHKKEDTYRDFCCGEDG